MKSKLLFIILIFFLCIYSTQSQTSENRYLVLFQENSIRKSINCPESLELKGSAIANNTTLASATSRRNDFSVTFNQKPERIELIINYYGYYDNAIAKATYIKGLNYPYYLSAYTSTGSSGCERVDFSSSVTVDDPIEFNTITFGGSTNACTNTPLEITTGPYCYNSKDETHIEVLGKDNQWYIIRSSLAIYGGIYNIDYSTLSSYIELGSPFKIRTRKKLLDDSYSTITYPQSFIYNPTINLPEGKEIHPVPNCDGGVKILIPYQSGQNYVAGYRSEDASHQKGGILISSLPIEGAYRVLQDGFYKNTKYTFQIEDINPESGKCPIQTDIYIPDYPVYSSSNPQYPEKTNGYDIPVNGEKAEITFTISNSLSQKIEFKAYNLQTGNVLETYRLLSNNRVEYGVNYYYGDFSIKLPAGEYRVELQHGACIQEHHIRELTQPAKISFTATPSSISCNSNSVGLISNNALTTNGKITLSNISGGIGTRTYSVTNQTTGTTIETTNTIISNLSPGKYTITIRDSYGNSTSKPDIEVKAPTAINIASAVTSAPSSLCSTNGSVTVSASGGTGTLKYSKQQSGPYQPGNTISGYAKGTNLLYIQDECGCVVEKQITHTVVNPLEVESIMTTSPSCNNDNDGKCTIVMKNVRGTLTVTKKPANSIFSVTGNTILITNLLADDNHAIELTESYNNEDCAINIPFSIAEKPAVAIQASVIPVSDKGTASGSLNISLSGGNPGYDVYLYSDAQKKQEIARHSGVTAGCTFNDLPGTDSGKYYLIEVIDTKGCSAEEEVYIHEPSEALQLQAAITKPVSCFDSSDATIQLTATAGWAEYQYSSDSVAWTPNAIFINNGAGTHKFYVKDKWNGTASVTITITQPQPLTIVRDTISHVLCKNESTGWIRYRIKGGTYPYSLTPNNGTITESIVDGDILFTITGLAVGKYQYTVTDHHGCSVTTMEETITEPDKLQLPYINKTNTTCELSNGQIRAKSVGGTAPYTYKIYDIGSDYSHSITLNESDTVTFENLPPASYRVLVTDFNGCPAESQIQLISGYQNPAVDAVTIYNAVCFGEKNGVIEVAPLHGTSTVQTFALHDKSDIHLESNTTGIFKNLYAGKYNIYVYDENGCRSNLPYPAEVGEPKVLTITIDKILPVATKAAKEGKIYFHTSGGNTGNKIIRLKDQNGIKQDSLYVVNGFQQNFTVYAGNYTLEIEDNKHCIYLSELLQVEEPEEALHFIITEKEDASCKSQTGRIVVEGIGGWGDYRYKRVSDDQFSTLNRFENLYPGDYLIEITDKMGAIYRESVVIHEPQDSLRAEVVSLQPPTCAGNGSISINISGGTAPYTLQNNQDTEECSTSGVVQWQGYESGQQSFYLADANGCHFELETLIPETDLLKIEHLELKHPGNEISGDGSIKLTVTGGVEPYSYQWKKSFTEVLPETSNTLQNIGSGYYNVAVTDAAGCSIEESVYLANPTDKPFKIIEMGHETSFNTKNGYAILYADVNLTDFALITPQEAIYEFESTDVTNNFRIKNDTIYLNNLESGKWYILGADANNQYTCDFIINPYPEFTVNRSTVSHVAAKGDTTGSIKIEIKGGGGENQFSWVNSLNEALASIDDEYGSRVEDLPAGTYTVTVEDKYGNQITKAIEVQEPAEKLTISLVDKKDQDCKDYEDAWVIVSANGGWGDYQFRHDLQTYYNNGSTFANLPTRDNLFYLIDKMGVVDSIKVEITEPEYLRASVVSVDSVKCKDNDDGSILFEITGGTPPYRFKELGSAYWIDGNHALNRSEGWYTYVFTDSHNCIGQDTLKVYVPEPDSLLFRDIQVTHTTCELDNGKIVVGLQGGTRPYYYSWLDYLNVEIGTDSVITDLKQSGVYTLNVVDANGCTQQFTQLINPSTLPRVLQVETTEVLCYGDTTGTARVTDFIPGVPFAPYTFTWSNGDTGDYSARFEKGTHHVTIADENGCSTTYYFEIAEPDSLYLNFVDVIEPQCYGYGNGSIRTETFGGKGQYSYLWSTGATTPYIEHLFKGDYWVELTDENGCYFRKEIFLDEPEYKTLDLGEDISMCPGNTVVVDGQDFVAHRWFTSAGNVSTQRYLSITKEGHYFLEATDENGCSVWSDIYVSVGNHALTADLLLPSESFVGDTLVVFELSNMELDSIEWMFNPEVFERIEIDNEYNLPYIAHFKCLQSGMYNIGLYAYAGGCYSPVYKQIEVLSAEEKPENEWIQIQPLIISLILHPNPTNGEFTVNLELREAAEVNLTLFEIASGICINQRMEQCQKANSIKYNLPELNTGAYALIVTAGNERRQVKIIIK